MRTTLTLDDDILELAARQALGQAALHKQRRRTQQQRADLAPVRQFLVPEAFDDVAPAEQ